MLYYHQRHRHHRVGLIIMILTSILLTLPFLGYTKRIVNSLEKIAEKKYL